MEKLLLFIKHNFSFLWNIIDLGNGLLFSLFYRPRLDRVLPGVFADLKQGDLQYRLLIEKDIAALSDLIASQPHEDLKYFNPHTFDRKSLYTQLRKPAFLMMGVFDGETMTGYFFLRFFANRKCFVGRLIDHNYRGKGIGEAMNFIMYQTAWRMHFRCLSTISRNNTSVMKAHARNSTMVVLKELNDGYMLVEFVRK